MIRKILQLGNAEIILTFATDSLIDYLSTDDATQGRLERLGLKLSADKIGKIKQHAQWRRIIQNELHQQFSDCAAHYTPFFIRSKDAHRDFWLIHLSGHATARDVMMGLHWKENTSFAHYGRPGLQMLGYDPDEDAKLTGRLILPNFYFDETAKSLCVNSLLEQLPGHVAKYRDGITFEEFFANLTNLAPATSEIFKETIQQLIREGEFRVTDKTGTVKRSGVQHKTDVLKRTRVKRLF